MIRGKKILGALLAFTLCFSMVIPAQADDISDAKKKQQELEQQKNTAEAEKSELSSELDSIVSKMEKTQSDLTAKENEINDAERCGICEGACSLSRIYFTTCSGDGIY